LRILDIFLSSLALFFLALPLFLVAVILRLTGEGKVIFIQERIGRYGERFGLIKLATMLENSPNIGTKTLTVSEDPRILPFGKILRKTKVNELTQILNILSGSMSIIGPRPMTEQMISFYTEHEKKSILSVRPGLSGIGSLMFRNEENVLRYVENPLLFYKNTIGPYKANLEIWYVNNRSIFLYCKLILLTLYAIIFSKKIDFWKTFHNLPMPPKELWSEFGYKKNRFTGNDSDNNESRDQK
jgi:lipopolysaccharide/colanic/teichoic acid biosynthesis glycosyltransferase